MFRKYFLERQKTLLKDCIPTRASSNFFPSFHPSQVMETKDMLYIVTEYAKNGEMFGEGTVHPDVLTLLTHVRQSFS